MRTALGASGNKSVNDLAAEDVHSLLRMALSENPKEHLTTLDVKKCKTVLDRYNLIDENRAKATKDIQRFFENPFYYVGVDRNKDFVVCKLRTTGPELRADTVVVEPFRRIKNIESIPELMPIVSMMKVYFEGKDRRMACSFIPLSDEYNEDLDVAFYYPGTPTDYHMAWASIPCQN